jgi:hypothetical protein
VRKQEELRVNGTLRVSLTRSFSISLHLSLIDLVILMFRGATCKNTQRGRSLRMNSCYLKAVVAQASHRSGWPGNPIAGAKVLIFG